ncbi:MAG: FHA domain-containing protein [Chloroflexi bacterium]|nr:FHA domain-containing protein [Chloroflexota bacterium]MCI0579052.1 FHA domain-containing protein [Chloroflexota bacterium]MCI0643310.1 FHA domain-containing protein [Chloroflexota bacterium]MCI0725845.1 FHA domain-containing protein [Chloroflexota bacterium]
MKDTPHIRLAWTDPGNDELQERVRSLPVTIGRAATNDLVFDSDRVSPQHARLEEENGRVVVVDLQSRSRTFVNHQRVARKTLESGDVVQIGPFIITVDLGPFPPEAPALPQPEPRRPELLPALFALDKVPLARLKRSGLPLEETTYLAIGGGLGSFAWVDHLLICGADPAQVVAIGLESKPYARCQRLCRNSQIPAGERLRSDSGSTPDNVWGWPGYAVREIWDALLHGRLGHAGRLAWRIFGEPTLDQTYTPRSGDVFGAIDREMARIGWERIWRFGCVKAIRKTDDGRYVVAYSQSGENGYRQRLVLARYVHLAVGYPGVRFLPDLQKYRQETGDFKAVVNAYEEHGHVYQRLRRRQGGTVLVRGRGITASRVIQRLYELRRQNPNVHILHLLRTPLATGNRFGRARRIAHHHWELQPFNWPKSAFGGELREVLEQAGDQEREQLLTVWGGTTTANRREWRRMIEEGLREGWYQIRFGAVREIARNGNSRLVIAIGSNGQLEEETQLIADYVIDCTGLEASLGANPLLKDLLEHHRLARNSPGYPRVSSDFELLGMRNGPGRMYASGVMTQGGPYAAVDSFLGLQYAAQRSVDSLTRLDAPGLSYLNGLRSVYQWLRWARGLAP